MTIVTVVLYVLGFALCLQFLRNPPDPVATLPSVLVSLAWPAISAAGLVAWIVLPLLEKDKEGRE